MAPPSEHTRTPREALYFLVLDLFTGEEFRRWLRRGPDTGVIPELPGESVADAAVIDKALAALERRGAIDAAFFARMTIGRERRRDEIALVAALWGAAQPAPTDPARSPAPGAPVRPPDLRGGPERGPSASDNSTIHHGSRASSSSTSASSSAPRETVLASWIHVSDLHFGHGDASHQWNQQRVFEELLVDAQALVRERVVPRPGFIFATGDIAFSGGARTPATGQAEYALASRWFGQLQQILKVPSERVFVVPGNHDVDRGTDADVKRLVRGARAGDETIDEILRAPRDLERLRGRMARYLAFAQSFGPSVGDRFHDGLWWRQRVDLAEGVSLRVCGLNTALLSLDDQDQGKLRIGQRQLTELFVPAPGVLELAVVLGHHPVTGRWLADEKDTRGQLDRHAAIHLFGHLHEADSEQARHGWGTGCLRIAAGAAHAEAGSVDAPPVAHGYNFGALVVLGSGDLAVRIWPRRWSTIAPRFVADVDNTNEHRDHAEHRLPEKYRIHRAPPTAGLHQGQVLGGRYRLVAELGQGGVGQVWRADDLKSGETVAVKVLNPDGAEPDAGRRAGFFRGALAMAALDHPAIARVRDPRPDPEKKHGPYDFYVMDFIDAPHLGAALKGAPRSDTETIEILLAIGEGVAAAHNKGVIHRDLKPSNILHDRASGRVVIIDFDTAKDLSELTMTRSGEGLASNYYASSEVLISLNSPAGRAPRVDEKADIFSLAVIGVFLRTGRNPSHHHMGEVIAGIECGRGLQQVLTKGCAHSATQRYASVGEMLAALRPLLVSDEAPTIGSEPSQPGGPPGTDTSLFSLSWDGTRPVRVASAHEPGAPPSIAPVVTEGARTSPPRQSHGTGDGLSFAPKAIEVARPSAAAVGNAIAGAPIARSRPSPRVMLQAGGALLAGLVAMSLYTVLGDDGGPGPNDGSTVSTPRSVVTPTVEAESKTGELGCPEGTQLISGTGGHRFVSEGMLHNIDPFCFDITEVTVKAFRAEASPVSYSSSQLGEYCNARYKDREDHPMNCVDWEQASAHCRSIGGRLPTEWEWEWAARGRDEGRKYPWGSEEPNCVRAIFSPSSGCGNQRTCAVGSLRGELSNSRDGLRDMCGNVWEWTSSIDSGIPQLRILRGGGWRSADPGYLRTDVRLKLSPERRGLDMGFRCAYH